MWDLKILWNLLSCIYIFEVSNNKYVHKNFITLKFGKIKKHVFSYIMGETERTFCKRPCCPLSVHFATHCVTFKKNRIMLR